MPSINIPEHLKPQFEPISLCRCYFSNSLEWSLGMLNAYSLTEPLETSICNNPLWRCYFSHSLEWSFVTLNTYNTLNYLTNTKGNVHHIFLLNLDLKYSLYEDGICYTYWKFQHRQTLKNSHSCTHPTRIQVY